MTAYNIANPYFRRHVQAGLPALADAFDPRQGAQMEAYLAQATENLASAYDQRALTGGRASLVDALLSGADPATVHAYAMGAGGYPNYDPGRVLSSLYSSPGYGNFTPEELSRQQAGAGVQTFPNTEIGHGQSLANDMARTVYTADSEAGYQNYRTDTESADTRRGQDLEAVDEYERRWMDYYNDLETQRTNRRGQDVTAETARRGQDVGAETARRGQDVGAETTRRGQDVGAETTRRGQDIGAETTERGQDLGASTARRGQDIDLFLGVGKNDILRQGQLLDFMGGEADSRRDDAATRRGQDVGAETTRRGQDIGAETARRGQDLDAAAKAASPDLTDVEDTTGATTRQVDRPGLQTTPAAADRVVTDQDEQDLLVERVLAEAGVEMDAEGNFDPDFPLELVLNRAMAYGGISYNNLRRAMDDLKPKEVSSGGLSGLFGGTDWQTADPAGLALPAPPAQTVAAPVPAAPAAPVTPEAAAIYEGAKRAIAEGRDKAMIRQRLIENGLDPAQVGL
jgi:hypothetical protein